MFGYTMMIALYTLSSVLICAFTAWYFFVQEHQQLLRPLFAGRFYLHDNFNAINILNVNKAHAKRIFVGNFSYEAAKEDGKTQEQFLRTQFHNNTFTSPFTYCTTVHELQLTRTTKKLKKHETTLHTTS